MIRLVACEVVRRRPCRLAVAGWSALLMCGLASAAAAQDAASPTEPPQAALLRNVAFKQRLNNQVPLDAPLVNDRGEKVTLGACMNRRPTIFVLAYYRCPMLCNQVLNGMARAVQALDFKPGAEFEIVVVSFDPSDTVELAADKKRSVVHAFNHDGDDTGWHFTVGDAKTVARIAESVGFQYQYDPVSQQYAHASGIVLLTPGGRVSRYFYGIDYPTQDVRLGLVEASEGRIGSPVDELLLFCFHYDPLTGRYGLAIMRLIRTAGVLTVLGIIGYVGLAVRRERQKRRQAPPSELSPGLSG